MSAKTREELKAYFVNGYQPSYLKYVDLIDSFSLVSHTHPGSDITSQVPDADTVDGAHASEFVRLDGDPARVANDFKAGGGIVSGSTTLSVNTGAIVYTGDLYSYKNSASNQVWGHHWLQDSNRIVIITGQSYSNQTLGITLTSHGIPDYIRAVTCRLTGQPSAVNTFLALRPRGYSVYPMKLTNGNNIGYPLEVYGTVPTSSLDGDISLTVNGSWTNVGIEVYGYSI